MILKAENEDYKSQVNNLLAKKEELRNLLKEKLQDSLRFKK
jgi:hypothetical protein